MDLETNHIALLQHRANTNGHSVLYKLPILRGSEPPLQWKDITIAEFAAAVDQVASFLRRELIARSIQSHSVVSLLFSGSQHQDLVYAIAVSRASYIPQTLPGNSLTDPGLIFSLAEKAGSKMILYDPRYEGLTVGCPYPKMILKPIETVESCTDASLPSIADLPSGSDVCFISLSSGSTSTSGCPKLIPFTQRSLCAQYKTEFHTMIDRERFKSQDVFVARGDICQAPQLIQYLGCLFTESCVVVPSKLHFSTQELTNMVRICGLNHIATYGTWLAPHIQAARNDPAVLNLLQELRTLSYGGVSISTADDDWCFRNGIRLIDMYGTAECGHLMASVRGRPSRFMRPAQGVSYRFDPVDATSRTRIDNPAESSQLLTFIVLSDSPQIPTGSHLLSADGNFHTRDLFEKQPDGLYLFRGRNDDRIKNRDADLIDAKFIEEKILEACGDLITGCVVLGHLRISPALFVEVNDLSAIQEDSLKELLLRRMESFNAGQLYYERIADKRLIFIMEKGTLPKTHKGNFRRKVIEEKYSKELDAVYMSVYPS